MYYSHFCWIWGSQPHGAVTASLKLTYVYSKYEMHSLECTDIVFRLPHLKPTEYIVYHTTVIQLNLCATAMQF